MLRQGQVVILCALALLAIGVVMVNSAGMNISPVTGTPGLAPPAAPSDAGVPAMLASIVFSRSSFYMALAVAAMALVAVMPVRRLTAWMAESGAEGVAAAAVPPTSPPGHARGASGASGGGEVGGTGRLKVRTSAGHRGTVILVVGCAALLVVLAMVYIPGLSREVNGSRRWVTLPGLGLLSMQPSEIAKWALVGIIAGYCACRASLMPTFWRGLAPGLIGAGVVAGAVAHEDLGTGVLLAMVAGLVLLAAGARVLHFAMFIPGGVAGFAALVISNPYRLTRIETFFNPYLEPQKAGYHMIQSMLAIAGGEGTGRGLGYGLQKFGYLPEDTTDFLFPIICEELGIAGAALVIGLYVLLLWSGLSIVRREGSLVLKLAGIGVLATVGLQALINLVVVTGLGPTKGIALPLISSGGTGWILTGASLGLLVAMDRGRAAREPEAEAPPLPSAAAAA
ncbi:MAG: FtsW/RodA/SpoVE family cell cycle protein [Phycisphaerales bacterium]